MNTHMRKTRRIGNNKRPAFTLVELLVVVSIIALLVAILIPSLTKARTQAKRTVCLSNLHQSSVAITAYQAANDGNFPWEISPQHWPIGGSNYIGDDVHSSDNYRAAGFVLLWVNEYIKSAEFFYCPSQSWAKQRNAFSFKTEEHRWLAPETWNDPTPTSAVRFPYTGYEYWANYRIERDAPLHPDSNYDSSRVANNRRPKPDQIVATDITTKDNGRPPYSTKQGWRQTNHLKNGEPLGGNELVVGGSATWHPFNKVTARRRLRLIHLDHYFVGPYRPDPPRP